MDMDKEQLMPNWIRLDGHQVAESTHTDPKGRFHPDLKWVKAAPQVQMGMIKQADGSFALPVPAPEPEPEPAHIQTAAPSAAAPTEPPPAA